MNRINGIDSGYVIISAYSDVENIILEFADEARPLYDEFDNWNNENIVYTGLLGYFLENEDGTFEDLNGVKVFQEEIKDNLIINIRSPEHLNHFKEANGITKVQFHDNTYMSVDFNKEEKEKLISLLNSFTYYKVKEVSSESKTGWGSSIVLFREDGSLVSLSNIKPNILEIDGYLYYSREPHGVGEIVANVLKRLHLPNLDEIQIITVSINDMDIVNSPYPRYIELDNEQRQEVLARLEVFSKNYESIEEPWYDGYDWIYSMYLSSDNEEFDLNIIDDNTIDVLGFGFYSKEPHNLVKFLDPLYNREE